MPTKKRYFTRNKEKVYKSPQDRTSIGNKSVNTRESVRLAKLAQDKKKANSSKSLLPNIPQTITDGFGKLTTSPFDKLRANWIQLTTSRFIWQRAVVWVFLTLVAGISVWQAVLLFQKTAELQYVLAKRSVLQEDLALWQGIAQKYPTYRDAYFQASVLAYRLGDSNTEQSLLGKTLQLDPNYLPAQSLEKISH